MDRKVETAEEFWQRAKHYAKRRLHKLEQREDFVSFAVCDYIKTGRYNLDWHLADFLSYWFGSSKEGLKKGTPVSDAAWEIHAKQTADRTTETLIDLIDPVFQKWNAREDWSEDAS